MQKKILDIIINVLSSVREPLVILDPDLKIIKANHAFYVAFCAKQEETEGVLIYDLGNGQWNIPRLRELLETILPENTVFNDFEVEHSFDIIGPKIMHLNARRIYNDFKKLELILLAIEDVTEKEYYKRNLEDLVKKRTAQLVLEKQKSEHENRLAEKALEEIQVLKKQLEDERAYLNDEIKLEHNHESIIGQSDGLKYVLFKIEQIAESNTTVMVLGETGTGKELVARAIHSYSSRKNRALIKVNCSALPSNLIESELFGHEKGAFTGADRSHKGRFEIADNATLFLDEIGELPLELQAKLLRVIQDGEFERLGNSRTTKVDVRIIAATNRNLEEEVEKGRFRSDLWYRLNVFPITIPPLRERKEDIPLLADFYINKISRRLGKQIKVIPQNVMNALLNYHWPGNIRELENVLERAVINSSSPKLHLADDLNKSYRHLSKDLKTLEAVERDYIIRVLEQTHWKVSGKNSAAQILGLNRSTLRARMRKLSIIPPERVPFYSQ
ncbi:MAG: sigma-54 interaction domain-containing protein [Desulfatirhabdiaceae bacterium]